MQKKFAFRKPSAASIKPRSRLTNKKHEEYAARIGGVALFSKLGARWSVYEGDLAEFQLPMIEQISLDLLNLIWAVQHARDYGDTAELSHCLSIAEIRAKARTLPQWVQDGFEKNLAWLQEEVERI